MRKIALLCCLDSAEEDAGTERYVSEIIRRLDKERFDVHLCCFEDGPRLQELASICSVRVLPLIKVFRVHHRGRRELIQERREWPLRIWSGLSPAMPEVNDISSALVAKIRRPRK